MEENARLLKRDEQKQENCMKLVSRVSFSFSQGNNDCSFIIHHIIYERVGSLNIPEYNAINKY